MIWGGENLLISPELYRSHFHSKLEDLCYSYGALVHMHNHGNIDKIIRDFYDIGIDILNPLDPHDGMNIAELIEKYGDLITFVGGINKFFLIGQIMNRSYI